jgi:superfamily II DNA/RNA helicase
MDMNLEGNLEGEIFESSKNNWISLSNFSELPIDERLKRILLNNTYDKMTNIQKESIPVVLKNSNVLIKAETGSGKTLAYAVPLVQYLINISENT